MREPPASADPWQVDATPSELGRHSLHGNPESNHSLEENNAMNVLLLVTLVILAYWIVGLAWVATRKDWN